MRFLRKLAALASCLSGVGSPALGSPPGAGERVYSPQVEQGEAEIEFRGARLTGGDEGGEGAYIYEFSYGVLDWWKAAVVLETENEPRESLRAEALEFENVFELPRFFDAPLHFGIYAAYELNVEGGADKIEVRWLTEYDQGPFNAKLNLNADRSFASGEAFEFGYGAQGSIGLFDDFALGLEAFGDFGTAGDFGSLAEREHYAGPVVLFEIEPQWLPGEIEVEAGYLFGLGEAEAEGQARLLLEWEFNL